MTHIFISYSKKNKTYTYRFADFLQERGFNIWIDKVGIQYGVDWWDAIVDGIENCAAFVVVMTPESKASDWVKREVFLGLDRRKPMFPLLLNGKNWPLFVATQYVDVNGEILPDDDFINRLSEYVTPQKRVGHNKSGLTDDAKTNQPVIDNRTATPKHTRFDVDQAMANFFRVYRERRWSEGLEILGRIRASGEETKPFNPDLLEKQIHDEIEAERRQQEQAAWEAERQRQYGRVRLMEDHMPPEIVWGALNDVWESFGEYDPEQIAERVRPQPTVTPDQERLITILTDPNIEPPERLKAGDELAKIGDPRKGVGLDANGLPDIDWVEIPEGKFIYQNDQKIHLPTYYLARYPLTHIQYQAFVDAPDGYGDPKWWGFSDGAQEWRKNNKTAQKANWPISNRPRERITWYESVAFCAWLSYKLSGQIPDWNSRLTWPVRLPTEQEWEKGARGTDGRLFPWKGDYISGYANINETLEGYKVGEHYLSQTSAVGMYPQGQSPYGLMDMSGNVWEWCLSEYNSGISDNMVSVSPRVLRGGSWYDFHHLARVVWRFSNFPHNEDLSIGVRLLAFSLSL